MKYRDIPEEIEKQLEELQALDYETYYRAIRHTGSFKPTDFYPSHLDEESRLSKMTMNQKGGFCSFVANLPVNEMKPDDYSLSLFCSKKRILNKFSKHRDVFPIIAEGAIKKEKGDVFHLPNQSDKYHCSCYMFDYVENNPYTEFKQTDEEHEE